MIRNRGQELYYACYNENWDVAKKLLNQKLTKEEVNWQNSSKNTTLHWACSEKQFDIVKLLVQKGANVNAIDSYNSSPLFHVLYIPPYDHCDYEQRFDIVKELLKKGANVNNVSYNDTTILSVVTRRNNGDRLQNLKLIHLLLDHNINPNGTRTNQAKKLIFRILSQRKSCRLGAIETVLCLRKRLGPYGRDVSNLIGRIIWSQRADNCWS